jgi:quercetin dioxygenase-like cupin family protein
MGYKPSPRPSFTEPTHIPYRGVTRHLWGDDEAGEVADWIYVSSDHIHQIVFGMRLGGNFTHSNEFRTIFGADEVLYVLSGEMLLANPETGEVHRVPKGRAAFFRKDTWHHAYCIGDEEVRVLEFFAPPPSQGTSGAYARTKQNLTTPRYVQDDILGRWPMERAAIEANDTIAVLDDDDLRWRYEGADHLTLTGLYCATDHLTVGKIVLRPGQRTDAHLHGGQEALYVTRGTVHIATTEGDDLRWFELEPRDGFFVPEGVSHAYYNMSAEPVELLFAVAPRYRLDRVS